MKIWCNVHDAEQSVPGVMCWKKEVRMIGALRRHCRFVEMQLVPADARATLVDLEFFYSVEIDLPDFTVTLPLEDARKIKEYLQHLDVLPAPEPPKDPWDYDP